MCHTPTTKNNVPGKAWPLKEPIFLSGERKQLLDQVQILRQRIKREEYNTL